jgi:hypothetical protein
MPGAPVVWEGEILRAIQAWAQSANINVDVVPDSGDPLGAPGAAQADPRFGDIRVAARPLSDNVLAITTPSGYLGGTRVGDIVINSNALFSLGGKAGTYDLYSALLQEVGHAVGVANSTDPASPMFETYGGVRTGLTAGDVASIQALYGARTPDTFEAASGSRGDDGDSRGNGTFQAATEIKVPPAPAHGLPPSPVVVADISTPQDVDYFKIKTLASNPKGLTFRLNAGLSLLAPRMTVYGPNGAVLSTVQSVDPQTGVLKVTLRTVQPNAYYTVRVEAATPAWGVGAYQLKAVFDPNAPDAVTDATVTTLDDAHADDTLATPTKLSTGTGYAANTHYTTQATIRDAADVDFYQVRAPKAGANQQNVLTVNVRALDPDGLTPLVQVYDSNKQLVDAQVLANGNGTYTVQVANAVSNQNYSIRVAAANAGAAGAYQFSADFRSQVINLQQFAAGTLADGAAQDFGTLQVGHSQMMYFALSAGGATVPSGVRLTIYDASGHVVSSLFAPAGQTVTATTYLAAGAYTVRFDGLTPAGLTLPTLTYTLKGVTLSDPIDPVVTDPTLGGKSQTGPDYNWTKLSLDWYTSLVLDLAPDVMW